MIFIGLRFFVWGDGKGNWYGIGWMDGGMGWVGILLL